MKPLLRCWLAALLLHLPGTAFATFHTYQVDQIFSNAGGSVQFVVMREAAGLDGQSHWAGHALSVTRGGTTRTFTFPRDLPGELCDQYYGCEGAPTAGSRVLIGTQGFAALGLVEPDYVIPDGFLPTEGATLDFAGVDQVTYAPLPVDGVTAIDRAGARLRNVATNFAGKAASVAGQAAANHQGLWWARPAGSESGWGLNIAHQGDTFFATLFTYDEAGKAMWLFMSNGVRQADGATYAGELYKATGSAFNAVPFAPISAANLTQVGTMSIAFSGEDAATLDYTVNGARVTKSIQKLVFGSRAANCVPASGSRASLANYQDLWWKADESGWGLNVTHQDNTLFATLFTYGPDGQNLWLFMSAGVRQPDGSFLGNLYRATGPAFNAKPFTSITAANLTQVGTMQLRFSDGENGTLAYAVDGATVSKPIVRLNFSSPATSCS